MLDPIIETSLGKIKGLSLKDDNGDTYYTFKGIPYAKSPIGDLRFAVSDNIIIGLF